MANYLDYAGLQHYDEKLKLFIADADREVLERSAVTIEALETPTEGSAATYAVYQNYTVSEETGEKAKKLVNLIEIPLDKVVESGTLRFIEATETEDAKCFLDLVIANDFDEEGNNKVVSVDISAIAGDIAEVVARVDALESAVGFEGEGEDKHLVAVADRIKAEAKAADYTVDEDGKQTESIGEALARFEEDITFIGTVEELPENPKKGDLYNIVPAEGAAEDAPKGWKFFDGENWQSLDDPTLTARVEALEATHAKNEDDEFQTVLKEVITNAKDGVYKKGDLYEISYTPDPATISDYLIINVDNVYAPLTAEEKATIDNNGRLIRGTSDVDIWLNADGTYEINDNGELQGTGTFTLTKEEDVTIEEAIKALEDATLDVNEYYGDTLAVDVINRLTSNVKTEGSLLERIYATAAAAEYTKDAETSEVETIGAALARIDGNVETDGSILKKIYDTAADGFYADEKKYIVYNKYYMSKEDAEKVLEDRYYFELHNAKVIGIADGKEYTIMYSNSDNYYEVYLDGRLIEDSLNEPIPTEEPVVVTIRQAIKNINNEAKVTVEKLETAEDDRFVATYIVKQNGEKVGVSINIPKDFLVKSGTVETCTEDNKPVEGYKVGDKYLDFVVNTVDGSAEAQHIYILVKDLVDVYTVEENAKFIQLAINEHNVISATIVDASIAREKIDAEFEADLKAIEDAIGYVDPEAELKELYSVAERINKEAKDGIYKAGAGATVDLSIVDDQYYPKSVELTEEQYQAYLKGENVVIEGTIEELSYTYQIEFFNGKWYWRSASSGDADYDYEPSNVPVTPNKGTTIAEAIKALEDASSDTNGALVLKGEVANAAALPIDAKKGDAYQVADEKALYIKTDDAWTRIANEGVFTLGNDELNKVVDIKTYIDSRIFIGTQEEVDAAKLAGKIDDSTFVVVTDDEAEQLLPIPQDDIDALFDTTIVTP